MLFLYNTGIKIYSLVLWLISPFNPKARSWIKGREGLLDKIALETDNTKKKVWFHFSSLGEFEQGRPVLERIRHRYPDKPIIITFFSSSGYEMRKNYPLADHVYYLPVDNSENAKKFISLVNPESAIFTKYDYWYHYFNELHKRKIPLFVISAIFWKDQSFFRWYGSFQRKMLSFITKIFVQDEESKVLLKNSGIENVIISGDTRFDRVAETAGNPKVFPEIQAFCNDSNILIAGSTWPQDEKLIAELSEKYPAWKFIIAPHEISESGIISLVELFPAALKYSNLSDSLPIGSDLLSQTHDSRLLIIDKMGILSSLYQYGNIAYIGGGFGVGIHNTLEAAAFGLPVIFGPNYNKFREARELIDAGAAFSIKNAGELNSIVIRLQNTGFREEAGKVAEKYVRDHTGATETIVNHIYNQM
jgi:3-deoxy-D-manno-octulosonic-acid transferase